MESARPRVLTRIRALLARSDVVHESCDLTGIIREVLALVGSDLARQAVSVQTSLTEDVPNVLADRIQIQQVLLNFLLNAAEASKDLARRDDRIAVRCRVLVLSRAHIQLSLAAIGGVPGSGHSSLEFIP
jgi:C4-dicarboxylate-specific signal transduction histidine kinase